jgi:NADPH:quinone reductase-like Zn-dependent oxidoreductase
MQLIHSVKLPAILGFDFSGVITSTGKSVTSFKEGDEVFGRATNQGAYAQYVAVPQGYLTKKPS